jgi:hypothetical protein
VAKHSSVVAPADHSCVANALVNSEAAPEVRAIAGGMRTFRAKGDDPGAQPLALRRLWYSAWARPALVMEARFWTTAGRVCLATPVRPGDFFLAAGLW